MYQFPEQCDHNRFFWWPNYTVKNKEWASLSPTAKAVFPVIASHAHIHDGTAFPSELTIAALSGYSEKTVREGIRHLEGFSLFKGVERHLTNSGNWGNKYRLNLPKHSMQGGRFRFFRFTLESGWWRELSGDAKAVYPVMRCFTVFDPWEYAEDNDFDEGPNEIMTDYYRYRKYDKCGADFDVIAENAGISLRRLDNALYELERSNLIEPVEYEDGYQPNNEWRVYIKSKDMMVLNRDYLNSQLEKSFTYALRKRKKKPKSNIIRYDPRVTIDKSAVSAF